MGAVQSFWIPKGDGVVPYLRDTVTTNGSYPTFLEYFSGGEAVITNVRPKIPICSCFGERLYGPVSLVAATAA
jgi:hypothetical protein